jgi:TolA-binding protein
MVAAIVLSLSACHRGGTRPGASIPVAAPPASLVALNNGNKDFSTGAYGAAVRSYKEYLTLEPNGDRGDDALFHLAMIYALPGDLQDWQIAGGYLSDLVGKFPASPFKPAAELILTLRKEMIQLTADSLERDQRIRQLSSDAERLSTESQQRDQRIRQLNSDVERLAAESQQRDQRIRQLSTELDRLIRVDTERRGR